MIKAKVLIDFNDKYTGKKHKKGDIIEVPPERFNEIQQKGRFIEAYVEEKATSKTEVKK